jgi:hypothetical protein
MKDDTTVKFSATNIAGTYVKLGCMTIIWRLIVGPLIGFAIIIGLSKLGIL